MNNDASSGNIATKKVNLHIRKLVEPDRFSINDMTRAAQEVYLSVGIKLEISSIEDLSLAGLLDLDVGRCMRGEVTAEQEDLFEIRDNVSPTDIVVYIIRSTTPGPLNGCAAHPTGKPACVVTMHASRWTLGHEVGHVLLLNHLSNSDYLMYGGGTDNITNPPPGFSGQEVEQMKNSECCVDI